MKYTTTLRLAAALGFSLLALAAFAGGAAATRTPTGQGGAGQCRPLPLPSAVGVPEFERQLIEFLKGRCYGRWEADPEVRDTGPFVSGVYYGTHPAVRVFYSPQAWDWMRAGRKGDPPDGALIVKEQFAPPAAADSPLNGWSIMLRDEKGSWDGWYWSGHGTNDTFDASKIDNKGQGFGSYCIRCHASAVAQTSTFASVRNVKEDPISFLIQLPTFLPPPPNTRLTQRLPAPAESSLTARSPHDDQHLRPATAHTPPAGVAKPVAFPNENLDHVVSGPKGPPQFVTSDQCIGCHTASDVNMSATFTETPVNLSPYTEWRASMMGLAGRDPVFHAQVESERAQFANSPLGNKDAFLDSKCFHCHGIMGQRQLVIDSSPGKTPPPDQLTPAFNHEWVYALPEPPRYEYAGPARYGALARDGISCAVCHQMSDRNPKLGTPPSFTGDFALDPPGTVNGPYKDVLPLPMKQALGITPEHAPQITSSALCGSCHTVITPVLDKEGRQLKDKAGKPMVFHEQTTYMEWLNSDFQNEPELSKREVKLASVQSCQDCHMPRTFRGLRINSRIANIEDNTYPYVDWRLPDRDLRLKVRDDYSRHTLVALNVFANQMFQQFADVLGVATADYMYPVSGDGRTPVPGLVTAENASLELAAETVDLEVVSINRTTDALEVAVKVTNLAGHSFPSGVEFRRGFLEFLVLDAEGKPVWASGRTNAKGEIVDGLSDKVLPTEHFEIVCLDPKRPAEQCRRLCKDKLDPARCVQLIQPHFFGTRYPITRGDQVQIYEELVRDNDGLLTNSFVRLFEHVKDNRMLPRGWTPDGPYAEFTDPFGNAREDPGYIPQDDARAGRGSEGTNTVVYRVPLASLRAAPASVQATLHYQALPPYYLADRFSLLTRGLTEKQTRETRRLKYLADYLNVEGTPVENWKLPVECTRRAVADGAAQLCAKAD
ncbi:MAG TPA: cytochrome P460 family protein [Pyrinomonadaceae bacterium]|nr:cytochrome P460 family protein [Pyrinomonadaceae bacterium]